MIIASKDLLINEEIRDRQVRVIDADGSQLGVLDLAKALEIATAKDMDLVKVAPQAKPPVCRIMDYGKYKFEQAKKDKEARKNQRVIELKEVRLSPNIDKHDMDFKVGHAKRFLKGGDKVKVSIRFRGREMAHISLGEDLLNQFAASCEEFGVVEKRPMLEGRNMAMFLGPKK